MEKRYETRSGDLFVESVSHLLIHQGQHKKKVDEESKKAGLSKEDALCRLKSIVGVNQFAAVLR